VVLAISRQASDCKIVVANGLDFLEAVHLDDVIEGKEKAVERCDEIRRRQLLTYRRRPDDVGEQHRDLGFFVGNWVLIGPQPHGYVRWKDVEQELFRPLVGLGHLLLCPIRESSLIPDDCHDEPNHPRK